MLLGLPLLIFRDILRRTHPHDIQRLRCCSKRLHDFLDLRSPCKNSGCVEHAGDGSGEDEQSRFINFRFAEENLRPTISSWHSLDTRLSNDQNAEVIRAMRLNWARLGPDYVAALFGTFGFFADYLLACFPLVTKDLYCFLGALHVFPILRDTGYLTFDKAPEVADFMASPIARLISEGVRTMMKHASRKDLPRRFLSDHLAAWILLTDDEQLFSEFLQRLDEPDPRFGKDNLAVLEFASRLGASRIVRTLVLSHNLMPTPAALQAAVGLGDAGMCRQDSTWRSYGGRSYNLDVPKIGPVFEPLKTLGPLTETETSLRRRALAVIDRLLGPFVRTNLPAALPALCSLGRAPDAAELRTGVSECGDPQRLVRACVAAAAQAGEARVTVEVLGAGAALRAAAAGRGGGGGSDAGAVAKALHAAYEGDRAEVAERVLDWAAGPGDVSPEEVEDAVRDCLRNRLDLDVLVRPGVHRCFRRALRRFEEDTQ
ncbi:hypothetical protein HK405_014058 [Cladochytrium tenue]|nr:hypothetical protein HK405_014058 [Cladochytrium tenue]